MLFSTRPIRCTVVPLSFLLILTLTRSVQSQPDDTAIVLQVHIKGAISQNTFDELRIAIKQAEERKARALLVVLDTPGGLMISMDKMIRTILASPVPVITYVGPAGASCGSAGVFILYSSHVAIMAPATNIGSATPVQLGGGGSNDKKNDDAIPEEAGSDDSINLKRKLMNHTLAQMQSLAEYRDRNSAFGLATITRAANITSNQALKIGVIEAIAESPGEALQKAHGRRVRMPTGYITLDLENITMEELETGMSSRLLDILSNPQLAYILFMLGLLGIYAEFNNPGSVYPGVIGGICLLLGLYAMHTLPLNYTGFALVGLGLVLFILEIKVVSYGFLSLGGTVAIVLGSIMLMREYQSSPLSIAFILVVSLSITGVMALLVYKAAQSQRSVPLGGQQGLLQEIGITRNVTGPEGGSVFIHSEIWQAYADDPIPSEKQVQVVSIEGLRLKVRRLQ